MKKLLILLVIGLGGCATSVPVTRNFPNPPSDLVMPSKLKPMDSTSTKMSDLLQNANMNYGTYYEEKAKNEAWIQWYNEQRDIWNSVK
jgi:hypothetical protein